MNPLNRRIRSLFNKDLKEILLHARNYFSANLATKALGFVSMPVFTRLLSESDYGVVSIFTASLALVTILSTLNLNDSIGRYYYEKGAEDFGRFLSSLLQFTFFIQVVFFIGLALFKKNFFTLLNLPEELLIFFMMGIFGLTSMKIYRSIHIVQKKSKEVASVSVVESFSGFGLSWFLVATFTLSKYLLRIGGFVSTKFISGIYMMRMTLKHVDFGKLKWEHIKYSLKFSLPRLPYVLSGTILSQFDRIMLGSMKTTADAGLYSVAYNVGGLSIIFIGAISSALLPNFYQLMNDEKYSTVDQLNKKLFWIIVGLGSGLMIFGGLILRVLADARFHSGMHLIPVIVLGFIFYSLAGVYNRYVGYYKITILQSLAAIGAGAVNILLNYHFIPLYGIEAAALTTAVSYAFQAVATWALISFAEKDRHMTSIKILVLPVLIALIVTVLAYFLYK